MNHLVSASSLYDRVSRVIPKAEWMMFQDDVDAILELKRKRNAVILAHNYQTPEIFHGVADIVGDSLCSRAKAIEVDADVIVLAGVHFMAETAKLLNPEKTVLIPDMGAGCSLADSITPQDIALLRQRSSRRAHHHLCQHVCSRQSGLRHLLHLGQCQTGRRIPRRSRGCSMIPDEYLAQNVAKETNVEDYRLAWPLRGA